MISLLPSHLLSAVLLIFLVRCKSDDVPVTLSPGHETTYIGPHYVDEGSDFNITCYTTQFKNPSWTKDLIPISETGLGLTPFQSVPGANEPLMISLPVENAGPQHAGIYKCHSEASEAHEIKIITGIISNEVSPGEGVVVDLWKWFILTCNVSTEPPMNNLSVVWYKEDMLIGNTDHFKVHNNNSLVVFKATEDECGNYTCKVNNSESDTSVSITVKMRPYIEPLSNAKSINKVEGESVSVECKAYGYPEVSLTWYKDGKLIEPTEGDRLTISDSERKNISTLKIIDLKEDDRAEYTCSASNTVGTFNTTVLVRVKDKLAALWPFLGIVAEVAVLCTIIFIYEKRRTKQEFDESDTDQSPDTKNVADNKDKDIRQRK